MLVSREPTLVLAVAPLQEEFLLPLTKNMLTQAPGEIKPHA